MLLLESPEIIRTRHPQPITKSPIVSPLCLYLQDLSSCGVKGERDRSPGDDSKVEPPKKDSKTIVNFESKVDQVKRVTPMTVLVVILQVIYDMTLGKLVNLLLWGDDDFDYDYSCGKKRNDNLYLMN